MDCHKNNKRNFCLQEWQRSNMSPSPTSSQEATDYAQAKAASYLFTGEKAGLWVSTVREQMQISDQRYQTNTTKVLVFSSVSDLVVSGGSLGKGLYLL